MNFSISVPELCLIRFCVRDQTGFLKSEFVGQYTLPFTSLKKGEPHRRGEGGRAGKGGGAGANLRQVALCDRHCVSFTVSVPDPLSHVFTEMPPHIFKV